MSATKTSGLGYQIRKLGTHGAIYGLGSISNKLIGFLLIPLYTHFLTPEDYGVLQLISLTIEVVSVIIGLRLAATVFRFYHETDQDNRRKEVVGTAMTGVIIMATILITPLLATSPWTAALILKDDSQAILLFIAFISLWIQLPISVVNSYIQVKERSLLFVGVSLSRLIAGASLNIYFVAVAKIGVIGILLSTLIVDIITGLLLFPYVIRENGLHFSRPLFIKMLRFSAPLIPSSLASMVTHASDRYFISGYLSLADTGIYSLGYKMGNSIHSLFYVPFSQVWNARRFAIEKDPDAKKIYAKVFTYFISAMFFIGLGMSLFATEIVMLMSPSKYWEAARIIPLIVLCYIVYAMEDHVSTGLWLKKKTERIATVTMATAGINLGLNFLLIPRFGMYGAVMSTLISFVSRNLGLYLMARKVYPIPFEWMKLLGVFTLCLLLYLFSETLMGVELFMRTASKIGLWFAYPVAFITIFVGKTERQNALDGLKSLLTTSSKKVGGKKISA
ncbi:MAG: lipopolysaccharide biosynthesis protein [Thermodesulfobacteriota bacterium]